jgi:hypothetical protein
VKGGLHTCQTGHDPTYRERKPRGNPGEILMERVDLEFFQNIDGELLIGDELYSFLY